MFLGDVANVTISGGTAGQALVSLGAGDVAFQNYSRLVTLCHATGSYVFPANYVIVPIKYETKLYDPQALYDVATGRFQPKIAGWYQMTASCDIFGGGTAEGWIEITHSVEGGIGQADEFGPVSIQVTAIGYFNGTTDYAFAKAANQLATTRSQSRNRSVFTAMYLSI